MLETYNLKEEEWIWLPVSEGPSLLAGRVWQNRAVLIKVGQTQNPRESFLDLSPPLYSIPAPSPQGVLLTFRRVLVNPL